MLNCKTRWLIAASQKWKGAAAHFDISKLSFSKLSVYCRCEIPVLRLLAVICMCNSSLAIAQTLPIPFIDPSKMFEPNSAEDSEADRKELAGIEVSMEEELQLGKQMVQTAMTALKQSGISTRTSGREVDYLQSLVETIRPYLQNSDRYETITIIFANSPRIDARSYPAGTLIFFEGLLDAAGSEAALIGIVGHELSHLDRGHQLLPIKKRTLMQRRFSQSLNTGEFRMTSQEAIRLWARPFRPEDEHEADLDGALWCYRAGYDPREMAKLFKPKGSESCPPVDSSWAAFFRSHPYDHERYEAILKLFVKMRKEHPFPQTLALGRDNLRKRFSRKQAEELTK